jgi:hypothetical protein
MHKHMVGLILNGLKVHATLTAACVFISNDARQLVTETTSKDRYLRVKLGVGTRGSGNHSAITDNSVPNARGRSARGRITPWRLDRSTI